MATTTNHCHYLRTALAIALICIAIPAVHATGTGKGKGFPPVCFTKSQKCCFSFFACGVVKRKVTETVDCPFKKCKNVCKPVCKTKIVKVPFKDCKKVKKQVGEKCKKVKKLVKHKWVWVKVCKPKFAFKRVCVTKFKKKEKKECRKKCDKECKTVQAKCEKIKVLAFTKFCPKLSCDKFVIDGSDKKPDDKVGKDSKVIKVIDGKRTIKH